MPVSGRDYDHRRGRRAGRAVTGRSSPRARSRPRAGRRRRAPASRPRSARTARSPRSDGSDRSARGGCSPGPSSSTQTAPSSSSRYSRSRPAETQDRLVLDQVPLERQPLAGLDDEDLADVAVGVRPDQLVAPRLLDAPGGAAAASALTRRAPAARRPTSSASRGRLGGRLRVDADERLRPGRPDQQPRAVVEEELEAVVGVERHGPGHRLAGQRRSAAGRAGRRAGGASPRRTAARSTWTSMRR